MTSSYLGRLQQYHINLLLTDFCFFSSKYSSSTILVLNGERALNAFPFYKETAISFFKNPNSGVFKGLFIM